VSDLAPDLAAHLEELALGLARGEVTQTAYDREVGELLGLEELGDRDPDVEAAYETVRLHGAYFDRRPSQKGKR